MAMRPMKLRVTFSSSLAARARIDLDAALGTAKWDIDEGGLPRHCGGEAKHLVLVRLGVKSDPTLVRPPRTVVLDAVTPEYFDVSVVHANRHFDRQGPKRTDEKAAHVRFETYELCRQVELALDDDPCAQTLSCRRWRCHWSIPRSGRSQGTRRRAAVARRSIGWARNPRPRVGLEYRIAVGERLVPYARSGTITGLFSAGSGVFCS